MGPREASGFHGVFGLFQAISLCDELVLARSGGAGELVVEGAFDCPPEATTIAKAVAAFRAATGIRDGVRVSAEKRIPAGAGLGGGSSDAASCLRALDALFLTRLGDRKLASLGAAIGSDVPFFFCPSALALVAGRGERVGELKPRKAYGLLVASPGLPSPTAKAYADLDAARAARGRAPRVPARPGLFARARAAAAYREPFSRWTFANDFEPSVAASIPEVSALLGLLRSSGSEYVAMTGSGSACYAVFGSLREALAALPAAKGELERALGPRASIGAFETLASRPSVMYNP